MPRVFKIAAIQMDASPAPVGERLGRAGLLVVKAANAGARLVVLPELFNTGYDYAESNYRRAELPDGPTVTWLRATASRLGVHLAGSLMLLHGTILMLSLLLQAPWLFRYLPQSSRLRMSCGMVPGCKIVDAAGRSLAELTQEQGEKVALADVLLAETRPYPDVPQPPSRLPFSAYLLSDVLLPALCIADYRRGLRRTWGKDMAPVDAATRRWKGMLGLGVLAGLALGWLVGRYGREG